MSWVPIVDPAIMVYIGVGYRPYDLGFEMDVFLKDRTGVPYYGKVCLHAGKNPEYRILDSCRARWLLCVEGRQGCGAAHPCSSALPARAAWPALLTSRTHSLHGCGTDMGPQSQFKPTEPTQSAIMRTACTLAGKHTPGSSMGTAGRQVWPGSERPPGFT